MTSPKTFFCRIRPGVYERLSANEYTWAKVLQHVIAGLYPPPATPRPRTVFAK